MFIQKLGKRVVYLDHIATTPVAQEVIDAMLPYFREHFGNPTSLHSFGQVAKKAINNAREKVAQLINANSPEEIVFTSGGIEANNLAIKGIAKAYEKKGRAHSLHRYRTSLHPAPPKDHGKGRMGGNLSKARQVWARPSGPGERSSKKRHSFS
jgi:hypothetical protein